MNERNVELEIIMTGMDPTAMQSVRWVTRLEGMVTMRDWSSTSCRVGQQGNKVFAATSRFDRITIAPIIGRNSLSHEGKLFKLQTKATFFEVKRQ